MYQSISSYDVIEQARTMDRLNQFKYDGWHALFDYLEQMEDDTGESIELDILALCCDFQRFEDIDDYNSQYSDDDPIESPEEIDEFACMIGDTESFITQAH